MSIQDVADLAGVSIATVSRVLNTPKLVSPDTAKRVREAVEKLGYVPNAFAQGLITRSSKVLAIALPDIHGEFYSELLRGADLQAKQMGYHLLVASGQGTANDPDMGLGPVLGLVDGLALMVTEPNDGLVKRAASAKIPCVVLDAPVASAMDGLLVDNEAGAREAVEHLLTLVGPASCQFIGGPRENFDTRTRAAAFEAVLKEHGATPSAHQMSFDSYSVEWGGKRAKELLAARQLKGAGVLAGNDEIALGVLHEARAAGLEAPRDFVIVGFDDTRLASLVRPSLSSVRVPLADAGRRAISLLVERIKNPELPPQRVKLATKLIKRDTTSTRPAA